MTATDASTAAGVAVMNAAGAAGAQVPGACFYASADGSASVLVFTQVYADSTAADSVSPEQMAAAFNGAVAVSNAKPVNGIGDKAIEYSGTASGKDGMVIFVFKANVLIMIAVSPTQSSAAIETLAKTAVGRL